jgi:hypothetical protein
MIAKNLKRNLKRFLDVLRYTYELETNAEGNDFFLKKTKKTISEYSPGYLQEKINSINTWEELIDFAEKDKDHLIAK